MKRSATMGRHMMATRVCGALAIAAVLAACGSTAEPGAGSNNGVSGDCSSSTPSLPAIGAVTQLSGGLCLSGGTAGADYALVVFHGSPTPSATAAVTVTGTGVTGLTSANRQRDGG